MLVSEGSELEISNSANISAFLISMSATSVLSLLGAISLVDLLVVSYLFHLIPLMYTRLVLVLLWWIVLEGPLRVLIEV